MVHALPRPPVLETRAARSALAGGRFRKAAGRNACGKLWSPSSGSPVHAVGNVLPERRDAPGICRPGRRFRLRAVVYRPHACERACPALERPRHRHRHHPPAYAPPHRRAHRHGGDRDPGLSTGSMRTGKGFPSPGRWEAAERDSRPDARRRMRPPGAALFRTHCQLVKLIDSKENSLLSAQHGNASGSDRGHV